MRIYKYKCDICGCDIKNITKGTPHPESADNLVIKIKSGFDFAIERVNGNAEDWEDQHVCKYCFTDAISKLDDRTKPG